MLFLFTVISDGKHVKGLRVNEYNNNRERYIKLQNSYK